MKKLLITVLLFILPSCMGLRSIPVKPIPLDEKYVLIKEYVFTNPADNVIINGANWDDWITIPSHKHFTDVEPNTGGIRNKNGKLLIVPPIPPRYYTYETSKSRKFISLDGSYSVLIPKLSAKEIFFAQYNKQNDPTAKLLLVDKNGWVIGIQSTKIHEDYPKEDSLLTDEIGKRRQRLQTNFANAEPPESGSSALRFFIYLDRLVLEERLYGYDKYDLYFFFSSIGFTNNLGEPIRINRCVVRNGFFIEISVYVFDENAKQKNFSEKAALEISDYILRNMSFG